MKKVVWSVVFLMAGSAFAADDPWKPKQNYELDPEMPGFTQGRFYISGGIGLVNLSNTIAKAVKNSIAPNWKSVSFESNPIWFGKAEYAVGRRHGVGLEFAHSGFDIHASVDSVTKYNIPVSGTLSYRSWSLLGRYNFHFLPESNFDLYAGIGVGFRSNKFTVTDNDPDKDWWNFPVDLKFITKRIPNSLSIPTVGGDFTLGMRYHIAPPVAVYAELGVAKSVLQTGVIVRF